MCFATLFWLGALFAAEAAPPARGEAVVTARLTPAGVHATVALDRPVTRFRFAEADVVRDGEFEILTPSLTLKGDEVTAAEPFRRFELRIRPITKERDAKYPAHYRVGEGGVIYAPALRADSDAWRTRMTFEPAPGQLRLPASGDLSGGFVYLGPPAYRSEHRGITVVVAPGAPDWLAAQTRADLAAAVGAFTTSLKATLSRPPLLIVKHDLEGQGIVADVTSGGVIAIRFHGEPWREADPRAAKQVQGLVLHETFHLWNGDLTNFADGTPTWLHEGGAEYASLLGGLSSGVLKEDEVRDRLGQALSRCRQGLERDGDKALSEIAFLSSQVRYPCGMALQWMADLHLRRATAGGRGVLDAWGDMIRLAQSRPSREYALADFHAAAALDADRLPRAMQLLLTEKGSARWGELPAALERLGASLDQEATAADRISRVMFHLLGQHCPDGEPRGYHTEPGRIRLESSPKCGVMAVDYVVDRIEDARIFDQSSDMFDAAERKCAAGGEVVLGTTDGRTLAVPCRRPLPPARMSYVVTRRHPPVSRSGSSSASTP